ncbi:MAG: YihY/virulence factor BrkB family protein [Thermodesulfobacteriota bacterium]
MKRVYSVIRDAICLFNGNGCFTSAAAISFYAFFSLIPIMLLVTAALGFVLGTHEGLLDTVIDMVRQSLPYLSDRIVGDLRGLASEWMKFGWISVVVLISSAELVLEATASALSAVFDSERRFSFIRRKIINLGVLLIGIFAALTSIFMTAVAVVFRRFQLRIFGIDLVYYLVQSLAFKIILPFLLVSVVVAVVFRIFSGPNLNFRYAFLGSVIFTVLWEVAKQVFTWYVSNFQSYNRFYASLGTLMILLIWMFYSANIFLFSASVARAAYAASTRSPGACVRGRPRS